jgi:hypothetical protein
MQHLDQTNLSKRQLLDLSAQIIHNRRDHMVSEFGSEYYYKFSTLGPYEYAGSLPENMRTNMKQIQSIQSSDVWKNWPRETESQSLTSIYVPKPRQTKNSSFMLLMNNENHCT